MNISKQFSLILFCAVAAIIAGCATNGNAGKDGLVASVPTKPALLRPVGSKETWANVIFDWEDSAYPKSSAYANRKLLYQLQVAKGNSFKNPKQLILDKDGLADSHFVVPIDSTYRKSRLQPYKDNAGNQGAYFWRVIAYDPNNPANSIVSEPAKFIVKKNGQIRRRSVGMTSGESETRPDEDTTYLTLGRVQGAITQSQQASIAAIPLTAASLRRTDVEPDEDAFVTCNQQQTVCMYFLDTEVGQSTLVGSHAGLKARTETVAVVEDVEEEQDFALDIVHQNVNIMVKAHPDVTPEDQLHPNHNGPDPKNDTVRVWVYKRPNSSPPFDPTTIDLQQVRFGPGPATTVTEVLETNGNARLSFKMSEVSTVADPIVANSETCVNPEPLSVFGYMDDGTTFMGTSTDFTVDCDALCHN